MADNYRSKYATLGSSGYSSMGMYATGGGIRPPMPTTNVSGYYIVPGYSAPGYDILTHGSGGRESNNGYFSIGRAYGNGASNCATTYMGSICQ